MANSFDNYLEEANTNPKTKQIVDFLHKNIETENISGLSFRFTNDFYFPDGYKKESRFLGGIYTGIVIVEDTRQKKDIGVIKLEVEDNEMRIMTIQGIKGVQTRIDWQDGGTYYLIKLGIEYGIRFRDNINIKFEPDLWHLVDIVHKLETKQISEDKLITGMGLSLEDAKTLLENKARMYGRIKENYFDLSGNLDMMKTRTVSAYRHAKESIRLISKLKRAKRVNLIESRVQKPMLYERIYKVIKTRVLGRK